MCIYIYRIAFPKVEVERRNKEGAPPEFHYRGIFKRSNPVPFQPSVVKRLLCKLVFDSYGFSPYM